MRGGGLGQDSELYLRDKYRKRVPQEKWRAHKNKRSESGKNNAFSERLLQILPVMIFSSQLRSFFSEVPYKHEVKL